MAGAGAVPAHRGLLDLLSARPDLLDVFEQGRTVVLDPGFFSMDWLIIDKGRILKASSGTSLLRLTPGQLA